MLFAILFLLIATLNACLSGYYLTTALKAEAASPERQGAYVLTILTTITVFALFTAAIHAIP